MWKGKKRKKSIEGEGGGVGSPHLGNTSLQVIHVEMLPDVWRIGWHYRALLSSLQACIFSSEAGLSSQTSSCAASASGREGGDLGGEARRNIVTSLQTNLENNLCSILQKNKVGCFFSLKKRRVGSSKTLCKCDQLRFQTGAEKRPSFPFFCMGKLRNFSQKLVWNRALDWPGMGGGDGDVTAGLKHKIAC